MISDVSLFITEMSVFHMDEFIDELLREERVNDIILPRIQVVNTIKSFDSLIAIFGNQLFYFLLDKNHVNDNRSLGNF